MELIERGQYLQMMLTPLKGEWVSKTMRCWVCGQIHPYAVVYVKTKALKK